ncbi:winged helix-turn-helix domain-containing protein [Haloarchaeobius amylolyticus]|uniref:winged helix-turn-helix domain-containing protein n=1 Tax=Haloarchaeobius amylolyticus TaxID=1198296 RepID=UPI00226FB931|nr:winged helix-turn-helix domain-containing protein [Haloarchaeobius amylolyticus]
MEPTESDAAPELAFWLLSDETRVAILRALWETGDRPVSFSDLRERVGNPNSGQFNYHLGKLREHFVAKGEDGYELTQAGREVVRAVLAGTLTEQPQVDRAEIDGHCVECGGTLVVRYDEYGIVECSACGETVMWNEFPPAGLSGRSPGAVAAAFDEWTRSRFHLAMDGICPNCAGEMSMTVEGDPDAGGVSSHHRCGNCKYEARAPLFGHVVRHPAVVSFYYDRGIDVADLPYWELQALAREFDETVSTEDGWTATVTIEADDESLRLTLDDSLAVTTVDWSGR